MLISNRLLGILLIGMTVALGVYQAATQQLVSVLIWFGLTALCTVTITLAVKGMRGFLWVTAFSLLIACVAPASWTLTYSKQDEYWLALVLGIAFTWTPAMLGIGWTIWVVVTAVLTRKRLNSTSPAK
jgi:hypothetical protein